jgi:uncharacterized membrane protein
VSSELSDKSNQNQESQDQESVVVARYMRSSISPLPPPEFIDTYEKHHKGTMKILLDMYSEEQTHRHEMEKNESNASIESMRVEYGLEGKDLDIYSRGNILGQILSTLICLSGLGVSCYLAMQGHTAAAVAIAAIPFAGIIREIMKK